MTEDVIIIGAGASGLMIASRLAEKGLNVLVLEADSRTGGRIHTVQDPAFPAPLELGAEFVHGNLPVTLGLLDEAGIRYEEDADVTLRIRDGKWNNSEDFIEGWDLVMQKMAGLKTDLSLNSFLDKYFPESKFSELRSGITRFAAGFDLADPDQVSTMFLYKEWQHEHSTQYRVPGGYKKLIDYLAQKSRSHGCKILTGTKVEKVEWKKGSVLVTASGKRSYEAKRVVITVPLGVLKKNIYDKQIVFEPQINATLSKVEELGFGSVVKYHALFENFFSNQLSKPAIILSDGAIPTWWVRFYDKDVLLTGWLGGPAAIERSKAGEAAYRDELIKVISGLFNVDKTALEKKLKAFHAINWSVAPFSAGAYSYEKIKSIEAKKILKQPIEGTVFFAGEGFYEGSAPGTVEAALVSGKEVAQRVLSTWKFNNA